MSRISFQNVSFQYRQESPIIDALTLVLSENQIVVLLGANGAGKSTFLKLCLGYLKPSIGAISVGDNNINTQPPQWIGHQIAYTPQSPIYPYQLSVRDYILLGRTPYLRRYESPRREDLDKIAEILNILQIKHLSSRTLQEISGGEKQLASFGRLLAQDTPILLMDEITSDLDVKNSLRVIQVLNKLKKQHTILFSTHDPKIAEAIADTIILFKPDHTIDFGHPKQLLTAENLSEIYAIPSSYIHENPLQILWNQGNE